MGRKKREKKRKKKYGQYYVIMGKFNAKVGKKAAGETAMGNHEVD